MIEIRRFSDLGNFQNDWLNAHYHFSFSHYYDPARLGHGKLRVWNDDTIQPNTGFPPHGHRDMEIITYVRKGAITHQDSLGNKGRTEAGDVQVMSAGNGVQHSEWNAESEDTTIFQLWIEPAEAGGAPDWGAKAFPKADRSGAWAVLASGRGEADALPIRQNAAVLGATLKAGEQIEYEVKAGRYGYLVLAAGSVDLNGEPRAACNRCAIAGV
ncbi:MAG: pirin family protein, partial [Pseudomonadota bacterium]